MFSAHAQRINTSPLLFTSLLAFTFPICLFYSKAKGWGKQNETYFPIHLSTHPAPPPPPSPFPSPLLLMSPKFSNLSPSTVLTVFSLHSCICFG